MNRLTHAHRWMPLKTIGFASMPDMQVVTRHITDEWIMLKLIVVLCF